MMIDDILVDPETASLKIGEVYLFSDSFLALKKYEKGIPLKTYNNELNDYDDVFIGILEEVEDYGSQPFVCRDFDTNFFNRKSTFIARI